MTKSVHASDVGKILLRHSLVPDTARFMFLFGDPMHTKNIKKHYKNEYARNYGKTGSRRELKRYEDEHLEKKSTDAFLNLFPQVARNPLGFAMDRARMSEEEQIRNFESETQILREILETKERSERDSTSWINFKQFRQEVLYKSKDNPLVPLLNYVDDNGNRFFHDSELMIWLFLVLLEHQFLSDGFRIGFSEVVFKGMAALDDVSKFKDIEGHTNIEGMIPIDTWMPKSNTAGSLCTTRYRVMHHMVQSYLNSADRERNHKHLHGKEFHTLKRGKHERVLCMNTALVAFHNPSSGNQFKCLLTLIFRAAEVFGMFQLVQFRIGRSPAKQIVENYCCFSDIADDFYSKVKEYGRGQKTL